MVVDCNYYCNYNNSNNSDPWWNCKKCKCVRDSLCKYPQENCYAPCQSGQQCYKFACGS